MFLMDSHPQFPICRALKILWVHDINSYYKHIHGHDMLRPLFDQFSRRRRIYVSMIVPDWNIVSALEHSQCLSNEALLNAKSSITVTSYAGLFNNLLGLTWKTTFKLYITVREINRRSVAPLTKGNDAEGKLMLSIYLVSGAICNKHNHNG